jgi:DNA-directed RNA polymerase sigma subunit (sigma70/sigma32)
MRNPTSPLIDKRKQKSNEIDAGIDKLYKETAPGQIRTVEEIAEAAGCSRTRIQQIEKSALRKLKVAMILNRGFSDYLGGV